MKHPEISVIIPCHKEAEVIETNILTVNEYLRSLFDRYEIVVVTDGSPDGTADVIDALITSRSDIPLTHIRFAENRGKGAAVKAGILASRFETVLFMDADLTIPIDELDEFMSALVQSDIVIASRLAPGARFDEPVPWYRVIMARGFHLLQILILGNFEFSDTQCGFKLFRRNAALDIFKRITIKRFAFDAELLFLARHNDYRVTILPVTVRKDPRDTNVRIVRDPIEMLFSLLRIRWNSMRGTYDNTVD
ncbi:MAG: glycosyltransferase [Candidatus Moranbacteria bacterium]|nr:glycosyltransferase [Candidatus Moranbacteria bacterium]